MVLICFHSSQVSENNRVENQKEPNTRRTTEMYRAIDANQPVSGNIWSDLSDVRVIAKPPSRFEICTELYLLNAEPLLNTWI